MLPDVLGWFHSVVVGNISIASYHIFPSAAIAYTFDDMIDGIILPLSCMILALTSLVVAFCRVSYGFPIMTGLFRCRQLRLAVEHWSEPAMNVVRKCVRDFVLVDSNGVQCHLRKAIRFPSLQEQFWLWSTATFVCSWWWQRITVHLVQLTDVEACFYSLLGFMVSFVSLLRDFRSLVGVVPNFNFSE